MSDQGVWEVPSKQRTKAAPAAAGAGGAAAEPVRERRDVRERVLPELNPGEMGRDVDPPIPVFIGKSRQPGRIVRIEQYNPRDEVGRKIQVPGGGQTVYLVQLDEEGNEGITGTVTAEELLLR